MRMRPVLASWVLVLAALSPAASHAERTRAAGALRFHVTVGGATRDDGTITGPIGTASDGSDFNGCAIVKQKAAANVLGAQTFEIHMNYLGGLNLLAAAPPMVDQEIYLQVMGYRPGLTSYPKAGEQGGVDLSFAIHGRIYGAPVHATARIRNGGRDGTLSARDAQRLYPGTAGHLLHRVTFQAAWHCTSVLKETAQF